MQKDRLTISQLNTNNIYMPLLYTTIYWQVLFLSIQYWLQLSTNFQHLPHQIGVLVHDKGTHFKSTSNRGWHLDLLETSENSANLLEILFHYKTKETLVWNSQKTGWSESWCRPLCNSLNYNAFIRPVDKFHKHSCGVWTEQLHLIFHYFYF